MSSNNGGPAFPSRGGSIFYVPVEHQSEIKAAVEAIDRSVEGMALRDYFAAKAMQTLIACVWERSGDTNYIIDNDGRVSLHLRAYEHADSMLAARNEGGAA